MAKPGSGERPINRRQGATTAASRRQDPRPDYSPDEQDLAIIGRLRANPACSNRELAQLLDVSESTVANRLSRMESFNAVRLVLQRDVRKLGISFIASFEISTSRRASTLVAADLAKVDRISNLGVVSGPRSIIGLAHARSLSELDTLIRGQIGAIKGVGVVEGNLVLEMIRFRPEWGVLDVGLSADQLFSGCWSENDPIDRSIIEILIHDGRISNREVGRRLGVSEGLVRQRLRKLSDSGRTQMAVITNPIYFGGFEQAHIGVNGPVHHLETLTSRLRKLESVAFAARTLGRWGIVTLVVAESRQELHELIRQDLRLGQDGLSYDVLEIVHVVKNRYDLVAL